MKTTRVILFTFFGLLAGNCSAQSTTMSKQQVIQQIVDYPISQVIKKCQKEFGYSDDDMVILERELKRYLTLSTVYKHQEGGTGMYSRDVDNLWHSFILFTRDYAAFCQECIGDFIHHTPRLQRAKTPDELLERQRDFLQFMKNYEELFEQELDSVWFLDMCEEDKPL